MGINRDLGLVTYCDLISPCHLFEFNWFFATWQCASLAKRWSANLLYIAEAISRMIGKPTNTANNRQ